MHYKVIKMMDLIMSSAYAEGTAAVAQPNPMMSLMPFFLIFGVFYFLMIRPQKKKLEEGIFIKVLFLTLHHLVMGQTEKNGN